VTPIPTEFDGQPVNEVNLSNWNRQIGTLSLRSNERNCGAINGKK
jgi:hypothetical protein